MCETIQSSVGKSKVTLWKHTHHTDIHIYACTYLHTCMHSYTHMHIHIHTYTHTWASIMISSIASICYIFLILFESTCIWNLLATVYFLKLNLLKIKFYKIWLSTHLYTTPTAIKTSTINSISWFWPHKAWSESYSLLKISIKSSLSCDLK